MAAFNEGIYLLPQRPVPTSVALLRATYVCVVPWARYVCELSWELGISVHYPMSLVLCVIPTRQMRSLRLRENFPQDPEVWEVEPRLDRLHSRPALSALALATLDFLITCPKFTEEDSSANEVETRVFNLNDFKMCCVCIIRVCLSPALLIMLFLW